MYQSKSGKVYANPAFGKMMDSADAEQKQVAKKAPEADSKDDKSAPTVKIVICTSPEGGYTTDAGDGQDSHPDVASLLEHLQNTLPPDASAPEDEGDESAPAPSILNAAKSLMTPRSK